MSDKKFFLEKIQAQIDKERARYAGSGYEFKERAAGSHTIGDLVTAILAIDNAADARRFFDGHAAHIQEQIDAGKWESKTDAQTAARSNIGWCFGEGMSAERVEMWSKATGSAHPFFGIQKPTFGEALETGRRLGAESRTSSD